MSADGLMTLATDRSRYQKRTPPVSPDYSHFEFRRLNLSRFCRGAVKFVISLPGGRNDPFPPRRIRSAGRGFQVGWQDRNVVAASCERPNAKFHSSLGRYNVNTPPRSCVTAVVFQVGCEHLIRRIHASPSENLCRSSGRFRASGASMRVNE